MVGYLDWWTVLVIIVLLFIFGWAFDNTLKRFEPVTDQIIVQDVVGQEWPKLDGLYAIWRDSTGTVQWNLIADTVVWSADTMIHPRFVDGDPYGVVWQRWEDR